MLEQPPITRFKGGFAMGIYPYYQTAKTRPAANSADYTTYLGYDKLEYYENGHLYFVNDVSIPAISHIAEVCGILPNSASADADIRLRMYKRSFDPDSAADKIADDSNAFLERVKNYYEFDSFFFEMPVILYRFGKPLAAGRANMIYRAARFADENRPDHNPLCMGYITQAEALEFDKLKYYLNLYAWAYRQTYHAEVERVGVFMPRGKRQYCDIPRDDYYAAQIAEDYVISKGYKGVFD